MVMLVHSYTIASALSLSNRLPPPVASDDFGSDANVSDRSTVQTSNRLPPSPLASNDFGADADVSDRSTVQTRLSTRLGHSATGMVMDLSNGMPKAPVQPDEQAMTWVQDPECQHHMLIRTQFHHQNQTEVDDRPPLAHLLAADQEVGSAVDELISLRKSDPNFYNDCGRQVAQSWLPQNAAWQWIGPVVGHCSRGKIMSRLPATYVANGPKLPLIIHLHGFRAWPALHMTMNPFHVAGDHIFLKHKDKSLQAIHVAPHGNMKLGERYWNTAKGSCCDGFIDHKTVCGPDDVHFVHGVIELALAQYPEIARDQIYLAGFSNGGFLTHRLVSEFSEFIAGFITMEAAADVSIRASAHPVSGIIHWGIQDEVFNMNGGQFENRNHYRSSTESFKFWQTNNKCGAGVSQSRMDNFMNQSVSKKRQGKDNMGNEETDVRKASGCAQGRGLELWSCNGCTHGLPTWDRGDRVGTNRFNFLTNIMTWLFKYKSPTAISYWNKHKSQHYAAGWNKKKCTEAK